VYTVLFSGLVLSMQTGDGCSTIGASRALSIVLRCNSSATTAQLVSVTQGEACYYTATVQTASACLRVDGVSSSSSSSTGGSGGGGQSGAEQQTVTSSVALVIVVFVVGVTMLFLH